MSSHREAPEIARDPVADSTDLYAFVSPDVPDTVTILANYIPLEEPAGGPNFDQFGDDVLYEIMIDNSGDGVEDITYRFRFTTTFTNPNTFLYNTGPIMSLTDANWAVRQTYSVSKVLGPRMTGQETMLGDGLSTPPANVGPRSTPNYAALANSAISQLQTGELVFAGSRGDGFFVDLGSVFDLGGLRPFNMKHLIPLPDMPGVNNIAGFNVHTIAIQIPMVMLTRDGSMPSDPMSAVSVIGIHTAASRQQAGIRPTSDQRAAGYSSAHQAGPWQQVSRLGNPLVNEVIIPRGMKDFFNATEPANDAQFAKFFLNPELAGLLPTLYPGVFPNLAALNAAGTARMDLAAILLTGIPAGVVPGFQNNTGTTQADLLRLNMAIPPTASPNPIGLLAGDPAGYPNGRRVTDDVVTIELRAIAGAALPLVDPAFKPDAATGAVTDDSSPDTTFLSSFPYLAHPFEGYSSEHGKPSPM